MLRLIDFIFGKDVVIDPQAKYLNFICSVGIIVGVLAIVVVILIECIG